MASEFNTVLINMITVVPPTIAALAAFKATQSVKAQVGEVDGRGTLATSTADTQSSVLLATKILDRMDERLEAVEKGQKAHEKWHAEGKPERRKNTP